MLIFDLEVSRTSNKIIDIGAIYKQEQFRSNNINEFNKFINKTKPSFYAGHNIVVFDLKYLNKEMKENIKADNIVDTLYLSALLFPKKPYHNLVKDDKLSNDYINNPLNDSIKAKNLLYDSINEFNKLDNTLKRIYYFLLKDKIGFKGFFKFIKYKENSNEKEIIKLIKSFFKFDICLNKNIKAIINKYPLELAYSLSYINTKDTKRSLVPPWLLNNYSNIENILMFLRNTPCNNQKCSYCNKHLSAITALNRYFKYPSFRKFEGVSLQEDAVVSALKGESLIAVFPTGGGKSLTFQLPALISGENISGLTVVISPLLSLMKDQVDNLYEKGISNVAYINSLLNSVERKNAINRVLDGTVNILYIAPESLRSRTIERLLLKRQVVRFVIDEAHCFSSWGHDFRVDYLFIGTFIKNLKEKKQLKTDIPVSCFTATAKKDVIEDIKSYFKNKLNLNMKLFKTESQRSNLEYNVIKVSEEDDDRYIQLRNLLEGNKAPTIIYASRTNVIDSIYIRLKKDNFNVSKFHGKMSNDEKIANQNEFMEGITNIMVATNAFGMGVDKDDVGVVIHYHISDSLENYVQEAGRAGRDQNINALCYILYNEEDLNKHFDLLRQTKISQKEISQVWSGIKKATTSRNEFTKTSLEISKLTGWTENVSDLETRIKTSILALEDAKYIERGMNSPRVYATSLLVKNMEEATNKIIKSNLYTNEEDINTSIRIVSSLISNKRRGWDQELAEARVDYLADNLGFERRVIVRNINLLREANILSDDNDLYAKIDNDTVLQTLITNLNRYKEIFDYLINEFDENRKAYNLKILNEQFESKNYKPNIKYLDKAINYLNSSKAIEVEKDYNNNFYAKLLHNKKNIFDVYNSYFKIAEFMINYLHNKHRYNNTLNEKSLIDFSLMEIKDEYIKSLGLIKENITTNNIEHVILMLQRLSVLTFEGGFLVSYIPMTITRLEKNNRIRYTLKDYEKLSNHYKNKNQQIHIVGRYANLIKKDKDIAHEFVSDYFNLDYTDFLDKHFPGTLRKELDLKMSKQRHDKLFNNLTKEQKNAIMDYENSLIGVAAGPGSGKTTLLVHKLANIIYNEDIRTEQLLMLTFSRNAAMEFKIRLKELIGNVANYISITTFHSYAFDLLGRLGSLESSDNIIKEAVELIKEKEADPSKITKMILVIDEAQDMSEDEYNLIKELIKFNEEIKVIAVGDDDQNIYEFRGSNSKYLKKIAENKKYELTKNFRSKNNIVNFSNKLISFNKNRMKLNEIKSYTSKNGQINITYYKNNNLISPLVKELIKNKPKNNTAIITRTNEEALLVSGLLNQSKIKNRLIQNKNNIKAYNLYEIRYFYKMITENNYVKIDQNNWYSAINKFESKFKDSQTFNLSLNIITKFYEVYDNPYITDFYQYLLELDISDNISESNLIVSNLHKVKGMQFDNVYLLYEYKGYINEEDLRALYVGITRSKKNLNIHTTNNIFKNILVDNTTYKIDTNTYNEPEVINLLFGFEDMNLGYFEIIQNNLINLKSGDELKIKNNTLYYDSKKVGLISIKGMEVLNERLEKDYILESVTVSYLVYWYNKEKEEEFLILLPKIKFKKNNSIY